MIQDFKITHIVILLFCGMCSLDSMGQFYRDTSRLGNEYVSILVVRPFRKYIQSYDEGRFIDYYFPKDSCFVTLFSGALQKTPLLEYPIEVKRNINGKMTLEGKFEGKYWREDQLEGGIIIYYNHVPAFRKKDFDLMLDSFQSHEKGKKDDD